ncbi:MAG TPA: S-layer homology domain-containing protein [Metalysinibacillus jejuensis]|uniref:S-layer homology domain-containing protein n=1 Tax=Metalysinibacillus jejuensis TaxID=914327 RepID=A0A921T580_9BACL|nr:S-layer homology domain-containing protein [Metalysinibacillus jejuensis]HJH11091.1 S-layer homology domain-containing protein [Metalysinibacillus jejuensis]
MKKLVATIAALFLMSTFAITGHAQMFKDIPNDSDSFYEVNYLINKEVISGYSDGTFRPTALIQKQHIAKMLVQALQLPTTNVTNPGYEDIPTDFLYYKEIAAAQNAGLFDKATNFEPKSTITRAEMAEVLARAYQLRAPENYENIFTDINADTKSYEAILAIAEAGITIGTPDKANPGYRSFMPNKELTRMHFTAFLARAMTLQPYTFALPHQAQHTYEVFIPAGTTRNLVYEAAGDVTWSVSNLTDGYLYDMYKEEETEDRYVMHPTTGDQKSLVIQKPIRIGTQPTIEETTNMTVTIISTMAKTTVKGKSYDNLVLVEQYDHDTKNIYHYFFAKDKGLIKQELVAIGEKAQLTPEMTLVKQLVE